MTLLYKRESVASPNRLDDAVMDATAEIESELVNRGYKIMTVSKDVISALDRSPTVTVSFATDAGFSMMYSIDRKLRSDPGVDTAVAELTVRAKVFVGASLLSVERGRGEIRIRGTEKERKDGQRRAMEEAARDAAADLVDRVDARLRAIGAEELAEYAVLGEVEETQILDLPLPPPTPGATPLAQPAAVHALLVGVSDYSRAVGKDGRSVSSLPGVKEDLKRIQVGLRGLGIPASNITTIADAEATTARVQSNISALAKRAGPDDLILLYISGHGVQVDLAHTGTSMPAFYDFVFEDKESAPDFEQLLRAASNTAASRIVMIVDTCFAGGAASALPTVVISSGGAKLARLSGAPAPQLLTRALDSSRNIAVLSSAQYDEIALDLGPGKGGLFTTHLVKGLVAGRGAKVLRDVIEESVAAPVIDHSRAICASQRNPCLEGQKQQTPTLGFSGGGDMIRM